MEICIGDYVRTFNGLIGKVVELTDSGNYAIRIYNGAEYVVRAVIKNHSKNIIDLIEVGDYVNGKEVYIQDRKLAVELAEHMPPYELLENIEIETILTNELYNANCYTVERKE